MYAVIKTGGKQYRVAPDDIINIEKLPGDAGEQLQFTDVLMIGGDGDPVIGSPLVEGASVAAEVVEQKRARKIIVFKKKRRKNYRRKHGHRQHLTAVRITDILTDGKKPAKKAAPKAKPKPKDDAKAKAAEGGKPNQKKGQDDISLISGVGPALEKKLHGFGVTEFKHIADMSEADIEKMDAELSLGGRPMREDWIEQARELMAGKPPRAKADKKAAAKNTD